MRKLYVIIDGCSDSKNRMYLSAFHFSPRRASYTFSGGVESAIIFETGERVEEVKRTLLKWSPKLSIEIRSYTE